MLLALFALLGLVSTGPDVLRGNQDLYDAIRQGDSARVRLLLDAGADPNSRSRGLLWLGGTGSGPSFSDPPLIEAIVQRRTDIIRLLLDRGGDATARDEHGNTALMRAKDEGQAEAVKALLDGGAGVDPPPVDVGWRGAAGGGPRAGTGHGPAWEGR